MKYRIVSYQQPVFLFSSGSAACFALNHRAPDCCTPSPVDEWGSVCTHPGCSIAGKATWCMAPMFSPDKELFWNITTHNATYIYICMYVYTFCHLRQLLVQSKKQLWHSLLPKSSDFFFFFLGQLLERFLKKRLFLCRCCPQTLWGMLKV